MTGSINTDAHRRTQILRGLKQDVEALKDKRATAGAVQQVRDLAATAVADTTLTPTADDSPFDATWNADPTTGEADGGSDDEWALSQWAGAGDPAWSGHATGEDA